MTELKSLSIIHGKLVGLLSAAALQRQATPCDRYAAADLIVALLETPEAVRWQRGGILEIPDFLKRPGYDGPVTEEFLQPQASQHRYCGTCGASFEMQRESIVQKPGLKAELTMHADGSFARWACQVFPPEVQLLDESHGRSEQAFQLLDLVRGSLGHERVLLLAATLARDLLWNADASYQGSLERLQEHVRQQW
ncbi:hypothetical protein [Acidovorax sp. MR-S7]|uniref:hypothetical protein n=1 Tax=Acidovorax sp. MR-S7 TaxID=1268622 RepID=UPI0003D3C030|nr:hypothetical protein [Acidovorax sp. MR-S7]GAD24280.1 hypothetical protein AVS7_04040 [Acidovorax sp. MR-S7]